MPPVRFHSLWSINAPLDLGTLCNQLDRFHAAGLEGVVFHPRFYPEDPPYLGDDYLGIVSAAILHAKALGLSFWIYDENGWPSGTVGGELLRQQPELVQRWAGLHRERPAQCLAEFEHEGRRWYLGEHHGAGVDYLNPALAPHFIRLTHERYRTGLTAEAFAHVEAFFCDEPEFGLGHAHAALPPDGAVPWTPGLAEAFAQKHGEALLPLIRDLFFTTERSAAVRVGFWELLRDRFCEAFLQPLNAWCESHGKRFTAHIKGEEHPLFQVPMVGSCSAVFQHLGLPGIDALERLPANDFYPRQLVSSARQFGDGRCMAEAFGGAGWGATPEDLERYLLWLGGNGVTDFVMHLSQYRLDSAAIRDWPPSQPFHLNWSEAYPAVLRRVREKLAAAPASPADTLVVSPHRAIMARFQPRELLRTNIHNAARYPASAAARINRSFLAGLESLQASGAVWHVTDEATFERSARRDKGRVVLGNCSYRKVLVANGADLLSPWKSLPMLATAQLKARAADIKPQKWTRRPVQWELGRFPENTLLLETADTGGGWFTCVIPALSSKSVTDLFFADTVSGLSLNGKSLPCQATGQGTFASLPKGGRLRFLCPRGTRAPFVWLQGFFRVLSRKSWSADSHGVRTRGPFFLKDYDHEIRVAADLTAAGFPFVRGPVEVRANFVLTKPVRSLRLSGLSADAARSRIDGVDAGWVWGPEWEIELPLAAGPHVLGLDLVPSTYNYFGPHHYYLGDRHVVSPDQFTGKKNFADPAGAPVCTLTKDWHFVPLRAPRAVAFAQ